MSIDAKVFNKILAQFHGILKGLYTLTMWDLSQECKSGSINSEKEFDETQRPFTIKNTCKNEV